MYCFPTPSLPSCLACCCFGSLERGAPSLSSDLEALIEEVGDMLAEDPAAAGPSEFQVRVSCTLEMRGGTPRAPWTTRSQRRRRRVRTLDPPAKALGGDNVGRANSPTSNRPFRLLSMEAVLLA